jgi:general stress protein 26
MSDKFQVLFLVALAITLLYTIIFEMDFGARDKYYHITTDESFYLAKKVEIDSNNCLIFVDKHSEKKVKVCGNYEIKNPKNEFED